MKKKYKVLIGDPSQTLLNAVTTSKKAKNYKLNTAKTGPDVLHLIQDFEPDLLILDLMIPHIHGIEIMKTIKTKSRYKNMGIIVSSYHVMMQNYQAAIEEGATYFLIKPFDMPFFFKCIEKFFAGNLKPAPFNVKGGQEIIQTHCYHPIPSTFSSYMRFWGTRGSNPVSGVDYVKYGGNTSCLEVRHGEDLIVIDAGTGIHQLGDVIDLEDNQTIHLFISHTHWDHITGFPFFGPLYKKKCNVIVWAPVGFEKNTKELFTNMLAYAYFPVKLDEMKAKVMFKELRDNHPISIGDIVIDCHYTNHPGPTVGFKIKSPNKTVGYITDNELLLGYHGHPNAIHSKHPLLEPHLDLIEFLKDCSSIIHEAQYFPQEYYKKTGWGHSSMSNATILFKYTGCKEWIVTHHDPNHKDSDLQIKLQLHNEIIKECGLDININIAYDGLLLPL